MYSEYLRRSFFVVLYGLYFVMSDAGCTTEVINGEEKVPVPAAELTFYFSKYAKFRSSAAVQKLVPNSLNDTPFEK